MLNALFVLLAGLSISPLTLSAHAGDPTAVPPIIDADAVDRAVNPCDDFYKFSCGKWLSDLNMPGEKSTYFHQFTALEDQTQGAIRTLIENAPADGRIAKFYASCMDESSAHTSGLGMLAEAFARIDAAIAPTERAALLAQLHLSGANVLFGFGPAQDLNNAAQVIGFASEGGMSLPERDYYLKNDAKSVETRTEFVRHVSRSLVYAGAVRSVDDGVRSAERVLAFETQLASAAYSLEDQGDPAKINHPIGVEGLRQLVPAFEWETYFATLGLAKLPAALNVTEPDFFAAVNKLLQETPAEDLRAYLKWHVVQRSASLIPGELEDEAFRFWQRYLRGKKANEPRWKRCVSVVGSDLGDEVGRTFVGTLKDADQVKGSTRSMIELVKQIFSANLDRLAWLDQPTVAAAREKLSHVNDKVAFPDVWKDYSKLEVVPTQLLANDVRATELESRRSIAKIDRTVDRAAWQMPPWEINAYYDPSLNEIVFPYGILQSPVFDLRASDAANMGALGATVGHELTHGFDNDGSKYDGFGNVKNWWSDAIRAKFEEGTKCLVEQADKYEVLPGMFVNGTRTLGENIADQGGTKLAYLAYKRMAANRPAAPVVAGFNEEQQYFVSYAQSWCAKRTDESMRLQLISNVHPPEEFRVNGVLMNIPAFAQAFGCADGSKMAPKNRCAVW
ncbi:MAG: M13 family metallopeptidase [Deltaproteobacteria bacterium]|nr:M13 family metallopeptidase [Deltaproteobacteria bacterium]